MECWKVTYLKDIFQEERQEEYFLLNLISIPLDYGSKELSELGCFLGSAAIVVLSNKDNMKDVGLNLLKVF